MTTDDPRINMDRLRRISDFWNWLPAYRAVAETEHVRTAAERLRVSPSALSRSIGLLEDSLGEKLFDREGRGIRLNRTGREFLGNLRAAMRLIDEGLHAVESTTFSGPIYIAVPDDLVRLLCAGLRKLRDEHPELQLHLRAVSPNAISDQLQKGALDIAFQPGPIAETDLKVEMFTRTTNGIYCGQDHPLFGEEEVELQDLLTHPFAAGKQVDGSAADNWPPDLQRHVRVVVNRLQAALEAAAYGGCLAALPTHVAEPYCERGVLWRVPVDVVPDSTFYILQRPSVVEEDRNSLIADVLHRSLAT